MDRHLYAGIDVGGTKIALGLVTDRGRILADAKSPTPRKVSAARLVRFIGDLLAETLAHNKLTARDLAGIGAGIPGIIDADKGIVRVTPNIGLSGVNLRAALRERFHTKVAIGNDVNLGLLGEQWLGAARGARNAVSFFAGTGVGGAVIINGTLVTGTNHAAGEFGHMTVMDDGPRCTCGNCGCLEAVAGRWAIERNIRKAIKKGKKTVITKLVGKKPKRIKSKFLAKALKAGDPVVTDIMTCVSRHLGEACRSVRHLLDPEVIVIGGGVFEACGSFMMPVIQKIVRKDPFFKNIGTCKVVASRLKDNAVILGAVALVK